MPDDEMEGLSRLRDEHAAFQQQAAAATSAAAEGRGEDATGSVTVTLSAEGRVASVQVAPGWRSALTADTLGAAVQEAVQAAGLARLASWGEAFSGPTDRTGNAVALDSDGLAERLQELSSGRMSSEDNRVALLELLAMAEELEKGIDEVSARIASTENAVYSGNSSDQRVTVTVTGSGDVSAIRYDQRWLRDAHEFNIGRQTAGAFAAAYQVAARDGVDQLVAGSRLGELQRVTRDPSELARRLRLQGS